MEEEKDEGVKELWIKITIIFYYYITHSGSGFFQRGLGVEEKGKREKDFFSYFAAVWAIDLYDLLEKVHILLIKTTVLEVKS